MLAFEAARPARTSCEIAADRVSRIGDRSLGRFRLDEEKRILLGQERIGLFFEGFLRLETIVGRLLPLTASASDGVSVWVYPSRESGTEIRSLLDEAVGGLASSATADLSSYGSTIVTSVESLRRLEIDHDQRVREVILIDPTCMVYRARNLKRQTGYAHDRPQIVAEFLIDQMQCGAQPVFMLMTSRRAAAIPTNTVARAFGLEAWWFLDGPTLRVKNSVENHREPA